MRILSGARRPRFDRRIRRTGYTADTSRVVDFAENLLDWCAHIRLARPIHRNLRIAARGPNAQRIRIMPSQAAALGNIALWNSYVAAVRENLGQD